MYIYIYTSDALYDGGCFGFGLKNNKDGTVVMNISDANNAIN